MSDVDSLRYYLRKRVNGGEDREGRGRDSFGKRLVWFPAKNHRLLERTVLLVCRGKHGELRVHGMRWTPRERPKRVSMLLRQQVFQRSGQSWSPFPIDRVFPGAWAAVGERLLRQVIHADDTDDIGRVVDLTGGAERKVEERGRRGHRGSVNARERSYMPYECLAGNEFWLSVFAVDQYVTIDPPIGFTPYLGQSKISLNSIPSAKTGKNHDATADEVKMVV